MCCIIFVDAENDVARVRSRKYNVWQIKSSIAAIPIAVFDTEVSVSPQQSTVFVLLISDLLGNVPAVHQISASCNERCPFRTQPQH